MACPGEARGGAPVILWRVQSVLTFQEATMRAVAFLAVLVTLVAGSVSAQTSSGPAWGPAPPSLPAGARIAVLQGDPGQAALFTIRLDFPDGYTLPPHFHPGDEHLTIIQGTFIVGMGDKADFTNASALAPGAFVTTPAGHHHFAKAKGHTVVQVHAMGPFGLTYVNPADDPQRKSAAR
jgi:quercetin dioxygenase-like cupin family protein